MRLIDADKLTERLAWYCKDCDSYRGILCRACHIQDALDAIEDSPAVDAESVRCGTWMPPAIGPYGCLCSRCHLQADNDFDYCPNCGAKMDKEGAENG